MSSYISRLVLGVPIAWFDDVEIERLAQTAVPNVGCGPDSKGRMLCWSEKIRDGWLNREQDTWWDRADSADPVAYTMRYHIERERDSLGKMDNIRSSHTRSDLVSVPRATFERVWELATARRAREENRLPAGMKS